MGLMVGILVGALTLGSALAASLQRAGRRRLADSAGARVGERARRGACSSASPASARIARRRRASIRAIVADRVARRPAASRQPRLPRPHVGALRDVGVDRRVPRRELRADAAGGGRGDGRRQARAPSRRSPPARIGSIGAGLLADRLGRTTITIAAMAVERHLRGDHRFPVRRQSGVARRRVPRLGRQHRRRFGAVLGVDRRAVRSRAGRHDADGADGARLHADAGDDPPDAVPRRARSAGATRSSRWRSAPPSASGRWRGCARIRARSSSPAGGADRISGRIAYGAAASVGVGSPVRRPVARPPARSHVPTSHGEATWPITSKDACSKSATAACCARAGSARIPTSAPATPSSPGTSTRGRSTASTCPTARSR